MSGAGSVPAAVVFDADGVLVDSEPAWRAARAALYARHGREFGAAEERATHGTGVAGSGERLAALLQRPARAGALAGELLELLLERAAAGPVRALDGAAELLAELRGRTPVAIASNAPRALLDATLASSGLAGIADAVVAADEVAAPKPAPDVYLAAADRLGVPARRSVAVEDSPAGVAAARAAGMRVVGLRAPGGAALDGAHEVVRSLREGTLRRRLGLPSAAARAATP